MPWEGGGGVDGVGRALSPRVDLVAHHHFTACLWGDGARLKWCPIPCTGRVLRKAYRSRTFVRVVYSVQKKGKANVVEVQVFAKAGEREVVVKLRGPY